MEIEVDPKNITTVGIFKNWFLSHKLLWPVFGIIILIGIAFYFDVIRDPCFNENYLGAELGPECANSLTPENLFNS